MFPGVNRGFDAGIRQTVFKQSLDQNGSQSSKAAAFSCDCAAKCTSSRTAISNRLNILHMESHFPNFPVQLDSLLPLQIKKTPTLKL